MANEIMAEFGWEPNKKHFDAALELLAMRIATSSDGDDGAAASAAAGGGGDVTLPAMSLAPGATSARPSPQAASAAAGQRMF